MPSKTGGQGFVYRGVSVAWNPNRNRFQAKVTVGKKADGTADRRNAYGPKPDVIKAEIRKLQTAADTKVIPAVGHTTVRAFFTEWIDEIHKTLERPLSVNTVVSYRSEFKNWIFPAIGGIALEDLTISDLDRLYAKMKRQGLSPGHLLKVHAIIRRGLALAMQRDLIHRNVAANRDNPGSTKGRKPKPLSAEQARRFLAVLRTQPTGLRWTVGIAMGPRQGEALGLTWECVDLEQGTIAIDWQLQRHPWQHGCTDPLACAAKFCRRDRCTPSWEHGCGKPGGGCYKQPYRCPDRRRGTSCPRHQRECPEPCPAGCDRHAARCPQRRGGGLVMVRPKTFTEHEDDESVSEVVTLPPTLHKALIAHKAKQGVIKQRLGSEYEDNDLVFCQADGRPVDPRADLRDLHRLLTLAGLPTAGTHFSRHTTVAILFEEGEDVASIQPVVRHTDIRTTRGYGRRRGKHETASAAAAMERALFAPVTDLAEERARRAG